MLFILEQFDIGREMDGIALSKYGIFFLNFFIFFKCIGSRIEDDECIACIETYSLLCLYERLMKLITKLVLFVMEKRYVWGGDMLSNDEADYAAS